MYRSYRAQFCVICDLCAHRSASASLTLVSTTTTGRVVAGATTIGTPVSQNSYLNVNYLLFGSISAEDSILMARSAVKGQPSIRM
jgi:hypothetical protein